MVRATQHALSLESRAQKPWPKGILKPQRWYILPYLSAGIAATIAAGVFIASNRPPQVYFTPLAILSAIPMYYRAAQIFNYFYGN